MSETKLASGAGNAHWKRENASYAPVLPASTIYYAAPPRQVDELRNDGEENPSMREEPFCSGYMFCFFLGMLSFYLLLFISPFFFLCGMRGLRSKEPHKIWAGKANKVALISTCLIIVAVFVVVALLDGSDDDSDD